MTAAGVPVFVTDRSACRFTIVMAVAELFAGTGSVAVLETVAVLLIVAPSGTLDRTAPAIVTMAEEPAASDGNVTDRLLPEPPQMPPPVDPHETKVISAGRLSVSTTEGAASGPALLIAIV